MDYIDQAMGTIKADRSLIHQILRDSLAEKDISCPESRKRLSRAGLDKDKALMLLALYKSTTKYKYNLSYDSLSHLFRLAREREDGAPLKRLFTYPFLIVKTGWLYEHAPNFLFFDTNSPAELDEYILAFASRYESLFLKRITSMDTFKSVTNPKKLRVVTFWENQIIDPVLMIEKVSRDNMEGLELSVDFHPFNYIKLLPEELTPEKREQIRLSSMKCGIKLDIHSPIVGPYSPFPDPKNGKQLFFDPLQCIEVISDTIELAKDVDAGSVVIHLVDASDPVKIADLIMLARDSDVRVTIENYCQTDKVQNSDFFISAMEKISKVLPDDVREKNFGITLDVGHFNIEGDDPLLAAEKVGKYCLNSKTYLRLHATDNYGKLLFSPPAYSADVHGTVSGRGINNEAIIKLLRSMGHQLDVVAEQIKPLTQEDIETIHGPQSAEFTVSYDDYVSKGSELLSAHKSDPLITPEITHMKAYRFLAGMEGLPALREHLVFRKIQDKKYLSVDEVKKISLEFMKMPSRYKQSMIDYFDDLLLPVQTESGTIQKNELDLICQNIIGALFGTINNEHLHQIFSETRRYGRDDIIFEQDTPGQEMYLIKEGEVTVSIDSLPLAVLGPGEIFGEISLFYNVKRTATIRALRDNTILGILSRDRFGKLLESSKPYSYDLIYRLYHILPSRLRNLNDKYKTAIEALRLVMNDERDVQSIKHIESKPISNLFLNLTREEVLSVFKGKKRFDKDQVIFTEEDNADGAYYILEGSVKAVTLSSDYQEILLGKIGRGEIFGEMALIDEKPRSATILATSPCKTAIISRKDFKDIISSRSELSFRLMAFVCLSLFWRILRLDKSYAEIKKEFTPPSS